MFANTLDKKRKNSFSTSHLKHGSEVNVGAKQQKALDVDPFCDLPLPPDGAFTSETVISNDLVIEGNVTSKGTVRLEGTLLGNMNCASFIVEERGVIKGNISAKNVEVCGQVEGSITGKNVQLQATALVDGDIYHQGIGIEMGAQYDGHLRWVTSSEGEVKPQENFSSSAKEQPAIVSLAAE